MNQDFTVKKKQYLSKKNSCRGVCLKKIPAQAVSEKKNSSKLKISHPPHHFFNGLSLIGIETEGNYNDIIKFEWDLNLAFSHDSDRDQNWKLHILHNCIHQHDPAKNFIKNQSLLQTFNSCKFYLGWLFISWKELLIPWQYVNSFINS